MWPACCCFTLFVYFLGRIKLPFSCATPDSAFLLGPACGSLATVIGAPRDVGTWALILSSASSAQRRPRALSPPQCAGGSFVFVPRGRLSKL